MFNKNGRKRNMSNKFKSAIILPDTDIVDKARGNTQFHMDSMNFEEDTIKNDWNTMGDDFVYVRGKKRVNKFIKTVHDAKINTERKMRKELDEKLLTTRNRRLIGSLGDNCMRRLQYYITAFNIKDEPLDV